MYGPRTLCHGFLENLPWSTSNRSRTYHLRNQILIARSNSYYCYIAYALTQTIVYKLGYRFFYEVYRKYCIATELFSNWNAFTQRQLFFAKNKYCIGDFFMKTWSFHVPIHRAPIPSDFENYMLLLGIASRELLTTLSRARWSKN